MKIVFPERTVQRARGLPDEIEALGGVVPGKRALSHAQKTHDAKGNGAKRHHSSDSDPPGKKTVPEVFPEDPPRKDFREHPAVDLPDVVDVPAKSPESITNQTKILVPVGIQNEKIGQDTRDQICPHGQGMLPGKPISPEPETIEQPKKDAGFFSLGIVEKRERPDRKERSPLHRSATVPFENPGNRPVQRMLIPFVFRSVRPVHPPAKSRRGKRFRQSGSRPTVQGEAFLNLRKRQETVEKGHLQGKDRKPDKSGQDFGKKRFKGHPVRQRDRKDGFPGPFSFPARFENSPDGPGIEVDIRSQNDDVFQPEIRFRGQAIEEKIPKGFNFPDDRRA